MAASVRDSIRTSVFSGKKFKTKKIKLFDADVEIRQPSVGQLLEMEQSDNRQDSLTNMLIQYCYVPGTNNKVFEPGDKPALLELPVSQWLTDFNEAIVELSGVDIEEPEKN